MIYKQIFLKYGNNIKSSKQLSDIIDDTFFCMYILCRYLYCVISLAMHLSFFRLLVFFDCLLLA